ncbi:hypothetical protein BDV18DRAFT_160747 [Aspergillus unguis]
MRILCLQTAKPDIDRDLEFDDCIIQPLVDKGHEVSSIGASDELYDDLFGVFGLSPIPQVADERGHDPDDNNPDKALEKAIKHILEFVEENGPFDVIMGIMEGAALAYELLDRHIREYGSFFPPPFESAVFVCAHIPWKLNEDPFEPDLFPFEKSSNKYAVRIPTAHIVGKGTPRHSEALTLQRRCEPKKAESYDHQGSDIRPLNRKAAHEVVKVIERVISGGLNGLQEKIMEDTPNLLKSDESSESTGARDNE